MGRWAEKRPRHLRAPVPDVTLEDRFWPKVDRRSNPDGCWLWLGAVAPSGYPNFWLNGTNVGAHRVALELKLGRPIGPGLVARHTCDVRACVRPAHLIEGTYLDNERDKHARGRGARGERQGLARLTADQVAQIRTDRRSTRAIARAIGVSQTTVRDVLSRRTWRHVA